MEVNDIVYFSFNDWIGHFYPSGKDFEKWAMDSYGVSEELRSDEFCKKNKIVLSWRIDDMSTTCSVAAPREYLEGVIPSLFLEENKEFISEQENGLPPEKGWGWIPYREYKEENFGSKYIESFEETLTQFVKKAAQKFNEVKGTPSSLIFPYEDSQMKMVISLGCPPTYVLSFKETKVVIDMREEYPWACDYFEELTGLE